MATPPRVVLVADDLTGAMDVAGPLAARGLDTTVVATTAGCTPQHLAGAEVVSINADSRHLESWQAAQRISDIVRGLVHPDADILIKKIDSTLRGNVVAETLAMLHASERPLAVVAPAFPAQGRIVRGGVVHVNGVALEKTNFARDALSPPPLEPLQTLFERAAPSAHVQLVRPSDPIPDFDASRRVVLIADSGTQDDLRALVGALRARLRDTLLVGSAGIAQAIGDVCFSGATATVAVPRGLRRILFVVGSRAEQSAQQVSALLQNGGACRFAAPNGSVDEQAVARATEPVLILQATPDAQGRAGDAAQVARSLAEGVARLLAITQFDAVVATGGDTAMAILDRLSQPVVRVVGDLLPGIPVGRIRAPRGDIWLVTKAGGFGAHDAFATIAQRLRSDERSG